MARNYKRDRRGRFARVAGSKAKGGSRRGAAGRSTALAIARKGAARDQKFWDKRLGPGVMKVTAGTRTKGIIRKRHIPTISARATSKANMEKMLTWQVKQQNRFR